MDLRNIGVRAESDAAVSLDTELDPTAVPGIEDAPADDLDINTDIGTGGEVPPGTTEI